MNRGMWYAVGAYGAWGLLPIYWKWLHNVSAPQLISHRIVWSCLLLGGGILILGQWQSFRAVALKPRALGTYLVAAALIGVNWLTYIWGVNSGFIVETSLGYFINPLLSVLLGVIFLGERLRPWQWVPIGLAAAGVIFLTITYGALPWIALTLAITFATYGLVKKTAPLNSLHGLTLETGLLFLPALAFLIYSNQSEQGSFLHQGWVSDGLLIGAGVVTTVPLLLFAAATQRIPLSLIGILQYIAPTIQFLLGVLVYKEPFSPTQLLGFSIVWLALIIFGVESLWAQSVQRNPVAGQLSESDVA